MNQDDREWFQRFIERMHGELGEFRKAVEARIGKLEKTADRHEVYWRIAIFVVIAVAGLVIRDLYVHSTIPEAKAATSQQEASP